MAAQIEQKVNTMTAENADDSVSDRADEASQSAPVADDTNL